MNPGSIRSFETIRKAVQRKRNCSVTVAACWHKILSLPFYSSFRRPVMQPIPERDLHYQTSVACCPCTHSQHPVWRLASSLDRGQASPKFEAELVPPLATVPIAHLKSFLDWILRAISIIKQPRPVEPVGREKRKKERERKEGRKKTCFHPFLRGRLKLRGIMGAGAWSMSVKPFSGARIHLSVPRRCPIRNNV